MNSILTIRRTDAQTDLPLIKIVLGTDNYLRETGVKVQCICPAFAQTAIIQNIDQYSAFSGDIYIFFTGYLKQGYLYPHPFLSIND